MAVTVLAARSADAQSTSVQYVYDETGRLIAAIGAAGETTEYRYDDVGNILSVTRRSSSATSILFFQPSEGGVGGTVVIHGTGFSSVTAENAVEFAGTAAAVEAAGPTALRVRVPVGAVSGPISVRTPSGSAISDQPFVVRNRPVVATVSPLDAFPTQVVPLSVSGANLQGASFRFLPDTPAPAITVTSAQIESGGSLASLVISIGSGALGPYVVLVTNAAGSSDSTPSPGNTLTVSSLSGDFDGDGLPNGQELALGTDPFNPDTDGDGFPDGTEFDVGANPLDPNSPRFVVASPPAVSAVVPGLGGPGGLAPNVTVANPSDVRLVVPAPGEPGGLGANTTVASPPDVRVVAPGSGEAGGLPPNTTAASPPDVRTIVPGSGSPTGLAPNTTVADPKSIAVTIPGV